MKKEDVKVGGRYLVSNGKNEMEVTVVRAGEAGFIVKTKSGKNMPVNNADRFLEELEAPAEEKAEKKPETAPVAKKEAAPVKAPKKVSKAVKFLPEKNVEEEEEAEKFEEAPVEEKTPVKKEKKAKKEKAEKSEKKMSMADAAIQVLEALEPKSSGLTAKQIIGEMETSGIWTSPAGKTPANTLTAIINRDIATSDEPRFAKVSRGHYKLA